MSRKSLKAFAILLAVAASATWAPLARSAGAQQASAGAQQPTVVRKILMQQDLNVPGYTMALVAVEIPAGGREGRHMHPGTLMAYVMEGTLTLDYEGKPTATYKVGDTFYVEPGKVHEGQNKGTVPVKLVATFVVQKGKPITTQVP